jgi:hypothetical protein
MLVIVLYTLRFNERRNPSKHGGSIDEIPLIEIVADPEEV